MINCFAYIVLQKSCIQFVLSYLESILIFFALQDKHFQTNEKASTRIDEPIIL